PRGERGGGRARSGFTASGRARPLPPAGSKAGHPARPRRSPERRRSAPRSSTTARTSRGRAPRPGGGVSRGEGSDGRRRRRGRGGASHPGAASRGVRVQTGGDGGSGAGWWSCAVGWGEGGRQGDVGVVLVPGPVGGRSLEPVDLGEYGR